MAVLQMQRICICGLKKERKKILELIQRRGVIEISDVIPEDSVFHKTDVSAAEDALERNTSAAKEALQILNTYVPEKKSMLAAINGRNEVTSDVYDAFKSKHDSVVKTVNRINVLAKLIAEHKAELLKLQTQMEILSPWIGLDVPMNFPGTKYTKSFIGTLPNTWTLETIYEILAEQTPLDVEIISSSREQTCIFILCNIEKADAVAEELRARGFSYPNSVTDKVPSELIKELEDQMAEIRLAIILQEEEIESFGQMQEDIQFLQDYESMRIEKYDVIGQILQSKNVFVMNGYIPKSEVNELSDLLTQKFDIAIDVEDPGEDENVPVILHNNGFSSPLEGIVEAFSPPAKGEIDPTMIMSLFYYMLFGLMLSDAGYGFIMAAACGVILMKFKNKMEDSMKKTLRMYLLCGISTIFWGIMFGSYFGDIVDVVSETFFGNKVTIPPLWFFPVNEPMRMLTFSMLLGIIHLLTGLTMKFYQIMKQKDYKSLIYDVVFWFVLLVSSVLVLISMDMVVDILGINVVLPSFVSTVAGIFAILAAIGIILTNGRESKNPFKRFLKGLYALYGITGYLSDVLSYSRLLALGLATGVICTVINKMAGMASFGGSLVGIIPFTIVILFGHTLNIAINALGAYVHTNRLQYVEFFGKFYEGGGRKFNPFSAKTKYYKFKEN
jgi:V/A-type H+/Na+-transporting ATPase subunit I